MSIRGFKLTSHWVFVGNDEGFSIGAHAAGVAGSFIQEMNNGQKIARITGLDPAGIGFDEDRLETVLDKSDADFVDVIYYTIIRFTFSNPTDAVKCGNALMHIIGYPL
jgi:hypothetical protein